MATRRDDNAAATRRALVRSGRWLFSRNGFDQTGIEMIADRARVTTGALYHHFPTKRAVFQAVAEQIEGELLDHATAAARSAGGDSWATMERAFLSLIEPCAQPDVQRLVFLEAPRVLGLAQWTVIERHYAYGGLCRQLERLKAEGTVIDYPAERLAGIMLAALREVAAVVADAPQERRAESVVQAEVVLRRIIASLRRSN